MSAKQPPLPQDEPDPQRKPGIPELPVADEDVDPLEPGGIAPGSPPGETVGSTPAVPMSEAERNERAGRRPKV